ncbi:hypothetical protein BDB00DRAFT_813690 [Zychaea mexicana]|uniref:uncharacterized protein n=1 Tax=Zychaea mexicana TaxID=64656 RepID=UPI0022FE60A0|nr:uncharacterized protein BDB00DRAFT_813690 [Zychaea mexicana]KAI9495533.1 hypothetical protein BDB00DRAFT_813690 [Zychaea mexicana]
MFIKADTLFGITFSFCNQTTMAWGCNCRNKVPDCPPYQWPVTLAECRGREQKCEAGCSTNHPTKDICTDGCKSYFRCNRPGGPQSRLQTEQPNISPVYDMTTSATSSATAFRMFSPSIVAAVMVDLLLSLLVLYC